LPLTARRGLAACAALLLGAPAAHAQAWLVARSVLPHGGYRAGSPASGAFFSPAERATAEANGVRGPASGSYLVGQPLQGVSSMVPADAGTWWALADNGYGARENSRDFQLVFHRLPLDALAIPDPLGVGGDGDFFRLPFYTIESVHVVDERTLLVASDNNFPFSNGRSRSRSPGRAGPLEADGTEIILVRLGAPLDADRRLFPATGR
jgi:hypothetical protein